MASSACLVSSLGSQQRPSPQAELHIQCAMDGTGTSQEDVPDQVLDVIGNGGRPLDYRLQDSLEQKLDADFSDVRIHTGGRAAQAADAIDAKAFTCGNDIVFNAGEYNPDSAEGQFLLAHELAHVKQQNGGAPLSMMPKPDADLEIDPDPQLEREADEAAKEALSGDDTQSFTRMGTDIHIQRKTDTWSKGPEERKFQPAKDTDDQSSMIKTFLEEFTSLEYRLPVEELENLVTRVDSLDDMYGYLAERDIEPTSDLEDLIDSPGT